MLSGEDINKKGGLKTPFKLSENSWKNLTSREIGSDCDYETKHSEATIKNLCLWGPSEFVH
jgi:hypothetical protein